MLGNMLLCSNVVVRKAFVLRIVTQSNDRLERTLCRNINLLVGPFGTVEFSYAVGRKITIKLTIPHSNRNSPPRCGMNTRTFGNDLTGTAQLLHAEVRAENVTWRMDLYDCKQTTETKGSVTIFKVVMLQRVDV